ncbi:hypothetical protein CFAM422_011083, partial [Trichoderma lentiforme]
PPNFTVPDAYLVKKNTTIHHPFILSDLKAVALRLLDDILGNRLIGAQSLPYQAAIEAHRSANAVVDMLFATIRPEIIELQGKIVSTAALTCTKSRRSKDSHWSSPVGYASFVTDARNSKYCNVPRRRIFSQHMQSILLGKHDTLHYFILWLETVMERPISSNFGSPHPIKYLMNGIKFKATYSRPCSARLFVLTTALLNRLCLVLTAPTRSIKVMD